MYGSMNSPTGSPGAVPEEMDRPPVSNLFSSQSVATGLHLTEDQVETMIDGFAVEDQTRLKTWSRRFVESFLQSKKWYFPRKDAKNAPSLSKAWAYYEHITLPRHFVGSGTADHVLNRAEPGETKETELYHPFFTPQSSLIEWGIGIDLYFSTLRGMAVILLICAFINLAMIIFYGSTDYSPNGKDTFGLSFTEASTAICTTGEWVVCSDCTYEQFSSSEEENRIGRTADNSTVLVLRNGCDGGQLPQGMQNWFTLLFLIVIVTLASLYLKAREIRFDEDKLTSTDYSIVVKNPPPDAYDPEEWKDFFNQFAEKQVTVVTVALNNEELLRKLISRRIYRNNLRRMLPKGTDMEDEDVVRSAVAQLTLEIESEQKGCIMKFAECAVLPILRIFNLFLTPQTLVDRVFTLTEEIKELQKADYEVSTVFVTFETEEGQRAALSALAVSKLDILTHHKGNVAPSAIFHGRILRVQEPTEPSAVRWLDLSAGTFRKIFWRVMNFGITVALVALAGYLVGLTRENLGAGYSGPLLSIFNSIIPNLIKPLMRFERHTTEGSFQSSLYLKITFFRWVNSAILIKLITPFTSTVSPGNQDVLKAVNALLWSELWLAPGLRLLDIMGNLKKHFLAPRALNQAEMNLSFQGTFYNLGERYTDLTKVLFMCFFYSALFPSSFFFGFAILVVQYYTDKFCLLRIWAWAPFIGPEVARFSRRYFFSGAVLAFALVSAYAWAQFPYDNLCDPDEPDSGVAGIYDVILKNGTPATISVTQDTAVVFCFQDWRENPGIFFPPTSRVQPDDAKWMNDSQETLTNIYGWTALVMLVGFIVLFFGDTIKNFLVSFFRGVHSPSGQDQHIDFSSNTEIFGYVPQIKLNGFPFPFLACNVDRINQGLIGWNDPANSYDYWNLTFDVPYHGMPRKKIIKQNTRDKSRIAEVSEFREISSIDNAGPRTGKAKKTNAKPIFSIIEHYQPAWQLKLSEAKKAEENELLEQEEPEPMSASEISL